MKNLFSPLFDGSDCHRVCLGVVDACLVNSHPPDLKAVVNLRPATSQHFLRDEIVDPCLVENHMWEVAQSRFRIRCIVRSLDSATIAVPSRTTLLFRIRATLHSTAAAVFLEQDTLIGPPKRQLQHVVRLSQERVCDAAALKNFHRPALHPVGLACPERPVTAFEDAKRDVVFGEPEGGHEAGGARAADENGGLMGVVHFGGSAAAAAAASGRPTWRKGAPLKQGNDGDGMLVGVSNW